MRAKLNRPEAFGMRSGDRPDTLKVTSGTKKLAMRGALNDGRDQQRPDIHIGIEMRSHDHHRGEDRKDTVTMIRTSTRVVSLAT